MACAVLLILLSRNDLLVDAISQRMAGLHVRELCSVFIQQYIIDVASVDSALASPLYHAQPYNNVMYCVAIFIMREESLKKIQIGCCL